MLEISEKILKETRRCGAIETTTGHSDFDSRAIVSVTAVELSIKVHGWKYEVDVAANMFGEVVRFTS